MEVYGIKKISSSLIFLNTFNELLAVSDAIFKLYLRNQFIIVCFKSGHDSITCSKFLPNGGLKKILLSF